MCDENKNNECCLYNLLNKILILQNGNEDNECNPSGCDKPFLGPTLNPLCYNTRPISFYNCQTGALWNINYTLNGTTSQSDVFRIENLDNCCCTCRILIEDDTDPTNITYTATNQFFTIDLNCISAVQCHQDVILDI